MSPRLTRLAASALMALCIAVLGTSGAMAQNLFAPVARVNDQIVTQYELNQRALFFDALRAPGNSEERALEVLIEERLQTEAARRAGVTLTDEQVQAGMEEFASRANLTAEQFVAALGQEGVDALSFREFVRNGLLWRELVGQRFGPRAQVTEAEIDRAIELGSTQTGVRVLLSEVILPADTPERSAAARTRATQIAAIDTLPAFASAAQQFSAAPSRGRGGRLDWMPLSNLPPQISSQVLALNVGEVTAPIPLPNAIALFQLRALEETGVPTPEAVSVEFARLFLPGGRTEDALARARDIEAEVDTCDDLYGIAQNLPEDQLRRDTIAVGELQGDIALELAQLDEGEVSTNLTTADGSALVFLMLCGRTLALSEDVSREQIRENLFNQRVQSYADGYLAELKADAVITYPEGQ
ncbi:peptidylprolyl isomerase [Anianabacter salinae]|uniref:peptidylprolyl isomerase n=1 Tax=Anianabacter salinae TaxID=2851023 RepID=UPI00225E3A13|nr:peptidylprolyl isomerase [Anianabacter salinae]MBV0914047.1 peptidylprolyl isomerase [Anianabacter salinae]